MNVIRRKAATTGKHSTSKTGKPKTKQRTTKAPKRQTKAERIIALLKRPQGAAIAELQKVTGWQKHSVHGALSRLRTRGFAIRLEAKEGRKAYRLAQVEA